MWACVPSGVEKPKEQGYYSALAYAFRAVPAAQLQPWNWETLPFLAYASYGSKRLVTEMPPARELPSPEYVPRDLEQLGQSLVLQPSVVEQQVFA